MHKNYKNLELVFDGLKLLMSTICNLKDSNGKYIDKDIYGNEISELIYSTQDDFIDICKLFDLNTLEKFMRKHKVELSDSDIEKVIDDCVQECKHYNHWYCKIAGSKPENSFVFQDSIIRLMVRKFQK